MKLQRQKQRCPALYTYCRYYNNKGLTIKYDRTQGVPNLSTADKGVLQMRTSFMDDPKTYEING